MRHLSAGLGVVALSGALLAWTGTAAAGVVAESSTPGYRAEATDLKRDGSGGVTLTLKIINDGDEKADLACQLRADGGEACGQITGVYLVDGVNKKRYLVMRDSDGKCICTDTLGHVDPKGDVTVWAKFAAPPDDIDKMTVIVPLFLPLDDVPVTGP
jgi:hypothetical protein